MKFTLIMLASITVLSGGAALAQDQGDIFTRYDADGDGLITEAEIRQWRDEAFTRIDTDGDDRLSAQEIEGLAEQMRAEAPSRRGRLARRRAPDPMDNDIDRDGLLSRSEFVDAPLPMLDRLDADHDRTLSQDELDRLRRRFGGRREG